MNVFALMMADFETTLVPAALSSPATADLVAAIYDSHHVELFTFAVRASRDRDTAEDLVHEAFVRLIVEFEAGRTPVHARAWLYRVVANLVVSRSRHATVAGRHSDAVATGVEDAGPELAYLDHERQAHLDVALGELEEDARTALLMAAGGFNGMEIAEAIGRSGNATRTLMCRARLQLRQRLASNGSPA
jgi:RNA polymerase sigma-70 factor (ECF subfamily)